jgi:branched-chain amino acid transport system permease protein
MHALAFNFGGSVGGPLASGLVVGCVYGLVAIGIVLIYKSNRIFNFAQAEFGSVAAFVALSFMQGLGPFPKLPAPLAVLCGLVAGTLAGLLTERLVIRPLFAASRATLVVATAGVTLLLISAQAVILGVQNIHVYPATGGQSRFSLFGSLAAVNSYKFGWTEITIVLSLAATAMAALAFFRTRFGHAVLAVSQDAVAARLVGISVRRISALTWAIAGLLGAVAGLVYAPEKGAVTPGFMTGVAQFGPLVFGLIAAVFGGMTSLAGAFVGGILVGVIDAFASQYMPASVPGGNQIVLAGLLLLVLLVRPTGLLGRET